MAYTLFTHIKLYPQCVHNVSTMCKMMCDILHILYTFKASQGNLTVWSEGTEFPELNRKPMWCWLEGIDFPNQTRIPHTNPPKSVAKPILPKPKFRHPQNQIADFAGRIMRAPCPKTPPRKTKKNSNRTENCSKIKIHKPKSFSGTDFARPGSRNSTTARKHVDVIGALSQN